MTVAYATTDQLNDFTSADFDVDGAEAERLLQRASEMLDRRIFTPFSVDTETDLPTDTDTATALANACCAVVEYWGTVGEEHDIEGLGGSRVSIGHLSLDALPPKVAERAFGFLLVAGLRVVQ